MKNRFIYWGFFNEFAVKHLPSIEWMKMRWQKQVNSTSILSNGKPKTARKYSFLNQGRLTGTSNDLGPNLSYTGVVDRYPRCLCRVRVLECHHWRLRWVTMAICSVMLIPIIPSSCLPPTIYDIPIQQKSMYIKIKLFNQENSEEDTAHKRLTGRSHHGSLTESCWRRLPSTYNVRQKCWDT